MHVVLGPPCDAQGCVRPHNNKGQHVLQAHDVLQDAQELIRLREALDFLWGVLPSDEVFALPTEIHETCRKNHLIVAHQE